ncbi:MAG: type II toxin-antitoxin system prevent-host-death family antitoxin [Clostridiales Family XIII bacterium]|jgi:prevent-host-death family protein|nr:type II toxin-antitoxin system prevent-host-death family antitoxin [Clostridiales Family XIII bacterium]
MRQVNIHEARTHLSALVEKAAAGEPFIIAKSGRPLVIVDSYVPVPAVPCRRTGFLKGRISVPADFDNMGGHEIANLFGSMP